LRSGRKEKRKGDCDGGKKERDWRLWAGKSAGKVAAEVPHREKQKKKKAVT
jgi:hypothetical protein